jgi:hydroxylamine reductase
MRRSVKYFLSAGVPLVQYLNSVKPGGAEWSREISVLEQHKIGSIGAWRALSADARKAVPVSPDVARALDAAAERAVEGGSAKRLTIMYGSQTGTAETYARMLSTYALSHGITPTVCSMDEGVSLLRSGAAPDAVVFICSTYGTGEFPSNALEFWKELSAGRLPELQSVPYAVMGLGNSHNDHFNAAAKSLNDQLKKMGAPSMMRMQLSCELENNGHDIAFRGWKRSLWGALGHSGEGHGVQATYELKRCLTSRPEPHMEHRGNIPAVVHGNAALTPAKYEPVTRMLRVTVTVEDQRKQLGRLATITDHVRVYPRNPATLVERVARRVGADLDAVVEITPLAGAPKTPFDFKKLSMRTLLSEIVDLSGAPSRTVLETLAQLAKSPAERDQLETIAGDLTPGGQFDTLVNGVCTIADLLETYKSVDVSVEVLMTVLPHIAPRSYSIASDNANGNHESFELLYATPVREKDGRRHEGLCSSFLSGLQPGDRVHVQFAPSNVELPRNDVPCLLIALGTGIGSAHSILQHRLAAKQAGKFVAPTHLFYGFRHKTKDCFFESEFAALERAGVVTTTYVASHDGAKFESPMDRLDASVVDFLGANGEVAYCGLGGSVPLIVENSLRRCGVDVAALRKAKRYHEEFFTTDLDTENLFKAGAVDEKATTLATRMGKCEMFCFQCEQTFKGRGCHKVGVCGKTPRVAALQDLTVHGAKVLGYYANELRKMGVPVRDEVNRFTLQALFATLTNVNFDEARFVALLGEMHTLTASVVAEYETACARKGVAPAAPQVRTLPKSLPNADGLVELGRDVSVLTRFTDPATQNAAGVSEMLVYGLKGIAAYADHSLMNKKELPEIYEFVHRALAFMTTPGQYDLGKVLELSLEAGRVNVSTMSLLYESNSTLGVPTPTPVPVKPRPGKAILVSGHDLIILKGLLEVTEPLGIDVYTHGEMLPAHSYPKLKQHKNLVGNFGGAWMRQGVEFPHFPGPVLMTTNCLTEPHESYRDRLFTAGAVGWAGIPHIGSTMDDIDFKSLVAAAQAAPGFGKEKEFTYADPVGTKRPDSLTVGFGHETVLSVAPTILEEIKKGTITRFFVVGGCDGYEGDRSYFTQLVSKLPKTAVVLTVGCGKYRFNYMDLGTIGDTGIPRILDMGQCNDSFSAVQVALALAKVLNCQVSDLPLTIALSWFEQKAIAVLLSCLALGLKPIHIGPALPAFITPDVLSVLVKDFGIRALGNVDEDLKAMVAATGAS